LATTITKVHNKTRSFTKKQRKIYNKTKKTHYKIRKGSPRTKKVHIYYLQTTLYHVIWYLNN